MNTEKKPLILFLWNATDELQRYFHAELDAFADLVFTGTHDTLELPAPIQSADILVGWGITEAILSAATRAQLVIIPAIGVDRHIPILRKFPHITAVNSRGNALPTAQHAIALLLAATNHILHFDTRMREGLWRAFDDNPASLFLENEHVGIVGTGTVGKAIVKRLLGFDCRISCCSRTGQSLDACPDIPVYPVTRLEAFLSSIRILIIAVPSTPGTIGLIGEREISLLQKDAILINVARGAVVQEKALYEALRDHRLMAAGIDVWYNYQPEPVDGKRFPWSYPFQDLPNIVLSPHRGASPLTRPGRYRDVVDNIKRFLHGEPLINRIDPERGY